MGFDLVSSNACAGTPTAGTAMAANTNLACGSTTNLSLTGSIVAGSGITYQWQQNNSGTWVNFGTSVSNIGSPTLMQSTQFRCIVSCNAGGSDTSSIVSVTVAGAPTVNLGNDTAICTGESMTLQASVGSGNSYLWNNGQTSQSITVSGSGSYSVTVTNGACSASDTINIGILPSPSIDSIKVTGTAPIFNFEAVNPQNVAAYSWNFGDNTSGSGVTSTHTYQVNGTV